MWVPGNRHNLVQTSTLSAAAGSGMVGEVGPKVVRSEVAYNSSKSTNRGTYDILDDLLST